jgi:D-alanyl-D-alanine carboxypeptidase
LSEAGSGAMQDSPSDRPRGLSEAFERIGSFLELRLPHTHAAGAALAVTDGDAVLGVVVRGFADAGSGSPVAPDTRFQIGSISKSFTSILALQEVEAGRLDLHARVADVVPWVELRERFGPITLHHLLTHSSGLPIGTEDSGDDRFAVWRLRLLDPGFPPGARFHYSNDGYKLAGVAVEHVAGMPLPELLRRRILDPLGMARTDAAITNETRADLATGYASIHDDRPPQERHQLVPAPWFVSASGDGSIVSNVVDMTAYVRMLLARGAHAGGRLLSEESFALLTSRFIEDDDDPGYGYGYGLSVGEAAGRPRWKHSGGMLGFTAQMTLDVEAGLGAVMMLNGAGDRAETVDFALAVSRAALAGDELPEVGPAPDPERTPNARDYAGTFRSEDRAIDVAADGERVRLREGAVDVTLVPEEGMKDTFLVPDPKWDRFWLRFGRGATGAVELALHGADRFVAEGAEAREDPAPVPEEWRRYSGHYRSNHPWAPSFRVVVRAGRLVFLAAWADEADLDLVPLGDGSFRVGVEEWRPDRLRFDTFVEGRALRAIYDEAVWYRSFTP